MVLNLLDLVLYRSGILNTLTDRLLADSIIQTFPRRTPIQAFQCSFE